MFLCALLGCTTDPTPARSMGVATLDCDVFELPDRPQLDWQQLHNFFVSPLVAIRHQANGAASTQWRADRGLAITAAEAGSVSFPAPVGLVSPASVSIAASAKAPLTARLSWTGSECAGAECSVPVTLGGEEPASVVLESGGSITGLALALPAGTDIEINHASFRHGAAAVNKGGAGDRAFPIFPAANVKPQLHDLRMVPGSRPAKMTVTNPNDPYMAFATRFDAADVSFLLVELEESRRRALTLYYASAACPGYSESCRLKAVKSTGQFLFDLREAPGWRGAITGVRIDLNRVALDDEIGLIGVRTVDVVEARKIRTSLNTGDRLARSASGLRRDAAGGPLYWDVKSGRGLRCPLPAEPGTEAPTELSISIPPAQTGASLLELRARWMVDGGEPQTALVHHDTFAHPNDGGWRTLSLAPPSATPSHLEVTAVCAPNCNALDADAELRIAQPMYRRPIEQRPPNVLVILLDTLRADHLSVYGYPTVTDPNLSAFAANATVYERVHAVDTWTVPGHTAVLAGRLHYITGRVAPVVLPDVPTLASVLSERGYYTYASTDATLVVPTLGLDRGFHRFDAAYEPADRKLAAFAAELENIASGGTPFFGFLQTYAVHDPYALAPSEAHHYDEMRAGAELFPVPVDRLPMVSAAIAEHPAVEYAKPYLAARYDAGISAVDVHVGALLARLEASGVLENTVVVVTSDHGEELLEAGNLGHSLQLPIPQVTHIPLIVRRPAQLGQTRVATVTPQTAIPVIIFEELGLAAPWREPCTAEGLAPAYLSSGGVRQYPIKEFLSIGVTSRDCVYIDVRARKGGEVVRREAMPLNGAACGSGWPAVESLMQCVRDQIASTWDPGAAARATTEAAAGDAHQMEQLKALGYVHD